MLREVGEATLAVQALGGAAEGWAMSPPGGRFVGAQGSYELGLGESGERLQKRSFPRSRENFYERVSP